MRIVTGRFKGRHFDIPRTFKARPTTDFAKENIFNVLTHYIDFNGAAALDLFAGTGSITLEMLSRGCSPVVSIELDRDHHRFITTCIDKLENTGGEGITKESRVLRADVFRFLKTCKQQFDFIFADPPYALKELPLLPDLVISRNLLCADGIFVLEHGKDHTFERHPNFLEHRSYGSVNFSLFRQQANTP
ncbi:MAG: RsmD family RNA methyltransferase [Prevotella sp.]|nr:RsmD family RNA methyltransferase [Prevotella sp.]